MEKIKKRITKFDLIFIGTLLFAGLVSLFLITSYVTKQNGSTVQILTAGKVYGTYDLRNVKKIPILVDGTVTNMLQIENGKAKMIEADCPDKLCLHQKAIAHQGETIVCLPNKIVVEIHGGEQAELDGVS